jgi:AraC-like DNA-binding protein
MNSYTVHGFRYTDTDRPTPVAAIIHERFRQNPTPNQCLHPDLWALDYCISNSGKFSLENVPWQKRPLNTAHLYPPGKLYMESAESGRSRSGFFLFKGESAALRRLVDNPAGFAQIADQDMYLLDLLRAGVKAAAAGNQGYWQLNIVFCKLMEALEHLIPDEKIPWRYTLADHPVENLTLPQKIAAYLEQNFQNRVTLDMLAEKFKCSKSNIVHKFKQEYSESAMEMLIRIRVEQSLPLLIAGHTLKEIADAVGFANEFYYSRIFRKIMGTSPKNYRLCHSRQTNFPV